MFTDDFRRGGEGGIRTPGRGFSPYNGLANGWLRAGSLVNCWKLRTAFGSLWTVWARLAAYWDKLG